MGFILLGRFYALQTNDGNKGPVLCIFRLATGIPCPFCGLTRAELSLFDFHFLHALRENVLVVPFTVFIATFLIRPSNTKKFLDGLAAKWWKLGGKGRALTGIAVALNFVLFDLIRIVFFPMPALS